MSAAVEVHGVTKQYGTLVAVEDLTFAVGAGEILGVLGPNGAGKTTAIRVLTTILTATRGTFTVAGIEHTKPAAIRRLIGVLPESAGFPERQTGEEYLRYYALLYGGTRAGARTSARVLLEEVGLIDRRQSLVASYSRGMRQRLGIARALVNEPHVVFLDEPTLGLDPAGQRQILGTVRKIARERGATVLLSTHVLAEVEEVCSRVLILNHGRVVADGTVSDVTRLAAAPRSVRLRVAPEDVERAIVTLSGLPGVEEATSIDGQLGSLGATLAPADAPAGEKAMNDGIRALLDDGISVLAFELEGARLSDAFLAMTKGG